MKKNEGKAKGGNARAAKLTALRRAQIAQKAARARWGKESAPKPRPFLRPAMDKLWDDARKKLLPEINLRDKIALAVLQGLYSNIADAQKFAAFVMGDKMPIAEGFTRIAYEQADEVIRLRAL